MTRASPNVSIGRASELEVLRGSIRDVTAGAASTIVIHGEAGIGKTFLMERMVHECAPRKLRTVKIVCRDTRNDALFIMRSIRETPSGNRRSAGSVWSCAEVSG